MEVRGILREEGKAVIDRKFKRSTNGIKVKDELACFKKACQSLKLGK